MKPAIVALFALALSACVTPNSTVPPTYAYFVKIVEILRDMKAENLTARSVLGSRPTIWAATGCLVYSPELAFRCYWRLRQRPFPYW